jgi:hypothetical protein
MSDYVQVPHRVRSLQRVVVTLTALTLVGCATAKNTPQQDYTYEMAQGCTNIRNAQLERVEPDGRYWVISLHYTQYQFFDCMNAQFKAHPFFDWAKAQKREASQPPVAVGSIAVVASAPSGPVTAPVWQVGDEWQYAYKSPSNSGTYVWSVNRVESLDGVPHYVIKTGTREIFYRVSDLAGSLERVNGVVVNRDTPSALQYVWPLAVGKSWEDSYRQERPVDRTTTDRNLLYTVDVEETVTVPAGTFRTLKITRRNKNTNSVIYEIWYAPDVKQWVKIREFLSNGIRERELIAFKLKQP